MKKQILNTFLPFFIIVLSPMFSSCEKTNKKEISDVKDIEQMMQEYRQAWRNGDSTLVLDKLSADIILFQPGKTGKPVFSKRNVREFWFPKSDIKYPIIQYEVENEEIVSSGNIAYYQGLSKLTWCTLENNIGRDTTQSISEFTNILKKEDGKWKIHRIMYNLKDSKYTR
ncbi:YybH family protein [Spongiimicrobium sp. 3-5]|uniref:YybH family protein n=1 Tax=Spongiimicrobium sp. 3-5 TaxID=3332596 RepID=UPI0039806A91